MAYEIPVLIKSFVAHDDFSTKQFHFVKQGAVEGEVTVMAAATDLPIGVLQNNPAAGGLAEVMMLGITKLVADEAIAWGDLLGTSADGQADKLAAIGGGDAAHYIVGRALEAAGGAGIIFTAAIDCVSPARAA